MLSNNCVPLGHIHDGKYVAVQRNIDDKNICGNCVFKGKDCISDVPKGCGVFGYIWVHYKPIK